jgi:autotransporter translocation and assembly factor TamB
VGAFLFEINMRKDGDKRKSAWRRLMVVLLILLAVVLLALVMLSLPPGEKMIKGLAERKLTQYLQLEVKIGRLETNLFSRVQIDDLQFRRLKEGESRQILRLERARLNFNAFDLLWHGLSIRSVDLQGLALSVSRDSSGSYDLPLLGPPAEPKPATDSAALPLPLPFERLSLRDVNVTYMDQSFPQKAVSLSGLDILIQPGGEDAYSYSIFLDSIAGHHQNLPFSGSDLRMDGWLDRHQLRLDSLSMLLSDMQLAGRGELLFQRATIDVAGDLSMKGDPGTLVESSRQLLGDKLPPIRGELDLALKIEGTLNNLKVGLELKAPLLDVGGHPIRELMILAHLDSSFATLNRLNMKTLEGSISGEGRLALDTTSAFQFSGSIDRINLANAWQSWFRQPSPYGGRINGSLRASGRLRDRAGWSALADISLKNLKYQSRPVPDVSVGLSFRESVLDFRLSQQESEMSAKIKLQDDQLEGQFSGQIRKIEPLAGLMDLHELKGKLQIQGEIKGRLDSPEISAQVEGREIAYQNFPVDTLTVSLLYRQNKPEIKELRLYGSLDPIDTLQPPFHLANAGGTITYSGQASGPVDELVGGIQVELLEPRYGETYFKRGLLDIALEGKRVGLSSLRLWHDSLIVQGSGEFDMASSKGTLEMHLLPPPPDSIEAQSDEEIEIASLGKMVAQIDLSDPKGMSIRARGDKLNLGRIQYLLPRPPDVDGLAQFQLSLLGGMESPHLQLGFLVDRLRLQQMKVDSLRGQVALEGEVFKLEDLWLYDKDHHSLITATVGLVSTEEGGFTVTENSPVQGQARGRDFDLRLLNPFLPGDLQVLSGRGSYELSWDGTLANPHPVGQLTLEDGSVRASADAPAVEEIILKASIQDSLLRVDQLTGRVGDIPFSVEARILSSPGPSFDVKTSLSVSDFGSLVAEGLISPDSLRLGAQIKNMELATLAPFLPDLQNLGGTLNLQMEVSGSSSDPELEGKVEIRGLTVQPVGLDAPLEHGLVKINFNRNEVSIDSVLLRLNRGTIFVWGSMTHDLGQVVSLDVKAKIDSVGIDRPKQATVLIKAASFSYHSQNGYYLLDGDISLGESRMLANFRPQSVLPFAQAVERPPQQLPLLLQKTRMDVRLRESDQIWVDNNLARLRLHTELEVIGSPAQPNLTGRVTVEEGYVLYLDRKFKIKQGVVDFIDPNKLNPIIDLRAETTVKTYRATETIPYLIALTITGPLDEVVVDLSSDPPQDKSNIISLLTVGATREELTGKDAEGKGASSALLERAQSLSSQKIAGFTSRKVGSLLGLDQFTIEGNLFSRDRNWGPQLLASKRISPRVELTYTTTVGHSNENSFRLDYRLSKHFSLEGETNQQGRAGMNLKYRLRSR